MTRRALITGITGQDGPYLAEYLLSLGYDVFGMVRGQSNPRRAPIEDALPDLRFVEGDLLDSSSLVRVLQQSQPDEIYNLAASRRVAGEASDLAAATDALGAERLFEAIRLGCGLTASHGAGDGVVRVFQASSYEMFDGAPPVVDERAPLSPRGRRGIAKTYAHQIAAYYRRTYGMFVARGVLFEHVSPRCEEPAFVRQVARAVANAKHRLDSEIVVETAGAAGDTGFAGDYVRAMHATLQQAQPDDFVIGTGEKHQPGEWIDAACLVGGVDPSRLGVSGVAVPVSPVADPAKARIVLDWAPRVAFREIVEMMVASEMERAASEAAASAGRRRPARTQAANASVDEAAPMRHSRAA